MGKGVGEGGCGMPPANKIPNPPSLSYYSYLTVEAEMGCGQIEASAISILENGYVRYTSMKSTNQSVSQSFNQLINQSINC
jgi:hypothetical protein